ncbi:MAG: uL4 family ribosomal protein, partial [Burkholderiales bacterium]|nr:uL4 family ribosomal protein [Burkholderiales bacterium]
KMYRAGVCAILSQLAREGRLAVVDSFTVDTPKTRLLAQKVKSMGFDNVLIVTDSVDENLLLSARNLPNVSIVAVAHADPVSLIRHANVLLTKNAMAKFEELLK